MKSRSVRVKGLRELIDSDAWKPENIDGEINKITEQFCVKFKYYQPSAVIEKGDIADLSMESDLEFFARDIKLNVGKGFFNKELEDKLVGIKKGETASIELPKGKVTVTVNDISRLMVPELTDELVRMGNLENIKTKADFLRSAEERLIGEQVELHTFEALGSALDGSEFIYDEGELDWIVEREIERCRAIAREQGKVFDDMSSVELMEGVGQPDIPSFKAMVRKIAMDEIGEALLYLEWTGEHEKAESLEMEAVSDISPETFVLINNELLRKFT